MIKKEGDTVVKYKYLINEILRMWYLQAKVIPVITGGAGTISKSLGQYQSNITGNQEIKKMQKKKPYWVLHKYCGTC